MENFIRNQILGTKQRYLPANTYNLIKILFYQNNHHPLFVPIRSMQYQAIIDADEVIFIDSHRRAYIEFSWQKFKPNERGALTDAVQYQFVYYDHQAVETMQRMQIEFHKFAYELNGRNEKKQGIKQDNIISF